MGFHCNMTLQRTADDKYVTLSSQKNNVYSRLNHFCSWLNSADRHEVRRGTLYMAVVNISSCWVYVISRRGIVQQRSTFGSIFLLFPIKVARAHAHSSHGKSPVPSSRWHPCIVVPNQQDRYPLGENVRNSCHFLSNMVNSKQSYNSFPGIGV